jgi:hypothetical protein
MKKIYSLVGALLFSVAAFGATFNLFTPATGILKGSASTYVTTPATSTDVKGLWTGTCDGTTYLRGDGSCQTPPGAGGGSVNSVSLTAPTVFSVTGSPVTSTGTLALTFAGGQTANQFLASPNGAAGAVALRAIVAADIPSLDLVTKTTTTLTGLLKGTGSGAPSAYTGTSCTNQFPRSLNASGAATCSSVDATLDITGVTPAANGGTGNGFTAFTGPATTTKTFTLPNASATILTSAAAITVAQGGTGVATLTGIAKGNGTSAFTAAVSGDVRGLWGGTCDATTYLRGDGSCQAPPTGGTSANPSATIGLTAVNGAASTFMRSDAAPALSQAIAPTWTGVHTFDQNVNGNSTTVFSNSNAGVAAIGRSIWSNNSGNQAAIGITSSAFSGSAFSGMPAGQAVFMGGLSSPLDVSLVSSSVERIRIGGAAGNVTINAPSSGNALAVSGIGRFATTAAGVGATNLVVANDGGGAGTATSIQLGYSQGANYGYKLTNTNDPGVTNAGVFALQRGTGVGYSDVISSNNTGNVTINAPSSGTSLTLNATNSSTAAIDIASGHLKVAGSAGTSGQVLTSGGASAAPSWTTVAAISSGTGSLTVSAGCVAGNSASYSYSISGNTAVVTVTQGGGLTCTSNTSSVPFIISGLAGAATPATTAHLAAIPYLIDNGANVGGYAHVSTAGIISLYPFSGAFTASGTKGVPFSWTITYAIN